MIIVALTASLFGCHRASMKDYANDTRTRGSNENARWRWEAFKDSFDLDVRKEKRGGQPTAGEDTWRGYWLGRANLVRKRADGGRLHIQYIIDQRRKAGLPDIPELYQ